MSTVAEILLKAADLIEHDGWLQGESWPGEIDGKPYRPGYPVCPDGAISASSQQENMYLATIMALNTWLGMNIVTWNDDSYQTKENVVATMRECAEWESNNEQ